MVHAINGNNTVVSASVLLPWYMQSMETMLQLVLQSYFHGSCNQWKQCCSQWYNSTSMVHAINGNNAVVSSSVLLPWFMQSMETMLQSVLQFYFHGTCNQWKQCCSQCYSPTSMVHAINGNNAVVSVTVLLPWYMQSMETMLQLVLQSYFHGSCNQLKQCCSQYFSYTSMVHAINGNNAVVSVIVLLPWYMQSMETMLQSVLQFYSHGTCNQWKQCCSQCFSSTSMVHAINGNNAVVSTSVILPWYMQSMETMLQSVLQFYFHGTCNQWKQCCSQCYSSTSMVHAINGNIAVVSASVLLPWYMQSMETMLQSVLQFYFHGSCNIWKQCCSQYFSSTSLVHAINGNITVVSASVLLPWYMQSMETMLQSVLQFYFHGTCNQWKQCCSKCYSSTSMVHAINGNNAIVSVTVLLLWYMQSMETMLQSVLQFYFHGTCSQWKQCCSQCFSSTSMVHAINGNNAVVSVTVLLPWFMQSMETMLQSVLQFYFHGTCSQWKQYCSQCFSSTSMVHAINGNNDVVSASVLLPWYIQSMETMLQSVLQFYFHGTCNQWKQCCSQCYSSTSMVHAINENNAVVSVTVLLPWFMQSMETLLQSVLQFYFHGTCNQWKQCCSQCYSSTSMVYAIYGNNAVVNTSVLLPWYMQSMETLLQSVLQFYFHGTCNQWKQCCSQCYNSTSMVHAINGNNAVVSVTVLLPWYMQSMETMLQSVLQFYFYGTCINGNNAVVSVTVLLPWYKQSMETMLQSVLQFYFHGTCNQWKQCCSQCYSSTSMVHAINGNNAVVSTSVLLPWYMQSMETLLQSVLQFYFHGTCNQWKQCCSQCYNSTSMVHAINGNNAIVSVTVLLLWYMQSMETML